jgi:hypothetical protein
MDGGGRNQAQIHPFRPAVSTVSDVPTVRNQQAAGSSPNVLPSVLGLLNRQRKMDLAADRVSPGA